MTVVHDLRVDSIMVGERLRPLTESAVAEIAESMRAIGQVQPISVMRPNGVPRLVAGAHRLAAARRIGLETIAAVVLPMGTTADDIALMEIDENLCRAELTPSDRARFIHKRKALYLAKHPEAAAGGDRKSNTKVLDLIEGVPPKRFTAATSDAIGVSEERVRLDASRGEKISEQALDLLRNTPLDKGVYLDRLKRLEAAAQLARVEADLAQLDLDRRNMRASIGARSATKEERGVNLYETPDEAVAVLLAAETFGGLIWEPACGRGAISKRLEDQGFDVILSDLVDYGTADRDGCVQDVTDFLDTQAGRFGDQLTIITNPPYGELLNRFVAHALREHRPAKMALLMNVNVIFGFADPEREYWMDENPPARIHCHTRRLPMMHRDGWDGNKADSAMNTAWFVWERDADGGYSGRREVFRWDWKRVVEQNEGAGSTSLLAGEDTQAARGAADRMAGVVEGCSSVADIAHPSPSAARGLAVPRPALLSSPARGEAEGIVTAPPPDEPNDRIPA